LRINANSLTFAHSWINKIWQKAAKDGGTQIKMILFCYLAPCAAQTGGFSWRDYSEKYLLTYLNHAVSIRGHLNQPPFTMRKAKTDWKNLDWSRSTTSLAAELKVSTPTVSAQRRRYAPETIRSMTPTESAISPMMNHPNRDKEFKLGQLRRMGINPLVKRGGETLYVTSLKSAKGDTVVSVSLIEFSRAIDKVKADIWSTTTNEQ
jgi:hypothetical protein